MKYTAINIGPIIKTFDLVRKPRDIWAASYMFSHLMKCVVDKIKETDGIDVFSPNMNINDSDQGERSLPSVKFDDDKKGVGLFPDRVYCKGSWDFAEKRKEIIEKFLKSVDMMCDDDFRDYFNIMCATVDVDAGENEDTETKAIRELNHLLDCLELNCRATSGNTSDKIWEFITKKREILYKEAFQEVKDEKTDAFGRVSFTITDKNELDEIIELPKIETSGYVTLADYASMQLSTMNETIWRDCRMISDLRDEVIPEEDRLVDEDSFYVLLKAKFKEELKSFHKYICVVQADGDNMGKTFSHKDLKDGETADISGKLVAFGKNASGIIYEYGGLPIYAGGDDLLFLAPVVGKTKKSIKTNDKEIESSINIFDLLKDIDRCFEPVKDCVVEKHLKTKNKHGEMIDIVPSMSYGVSITYYKFPLYEALASARHLLFDVAKGADGKNFIAWRLQKNSGSSLEGAFSKDQLLSEFESVILNSNVNPPVVSAVSYKIRENQKLLELWMKDGETYKYKQRNLNFFKKYMDYDGKDAYKKSILTLLDKLYEVYLPLFEEKDKGVDNDSDIKILPADKAKGIINIEQKKASLKQALRDDVFKMLYSMIRTAKFINGEEVKDE